MRREKWLDSEIALEVARVKVIKVVVQAFCVPRLCKAEVLVVGELAEILVDYVLKVVKHRRDRLDLISIHL